MTCSSIAPRRTITLLIVHCTATPAGREVSLSEVDQWHRQRGWKGIGYHYLIRLDGTVEHGRPEAEIGAHCQNHDPKSCRMNRRFHLSSFLLVLLLAMSCVATRRTPVVPLRSVRTDTLQLHTLHYDSVFIRQERYQDRSRDTVYLHDRSVEYQVCLLILCSVCIIFARRTKTDER